MEDYENRKRKQISQMRSLLDYGMGILFVIIGLYFLLNRFLEINLFRSRPSDFDIFIGILFVLYGSWRIYRGYKKDYFR